MKEIIWVKAARKDFGNFPIFVQDKMAVALVTAAEGKMADFAKPLKGFGSGVFEIALPWRTDAWRVIYAVQIGDLIWVLHAFQKKSTSGISTSKRDLELIKSRLRNVKDEMK